MAPDFSHVIPDTQRWIERAVIGLNLCPFAKAVHIKGQIHYRISTATDAAQLQADLAQELHDLMASDPLQRDTTLLLAPQAMPDFLDFNDFLAQADALLAALDLDGTIQIASFHPQYQFGGTAPGDISNHTNRAPYPTLHLLREASVARAVQAFPNAQVIYQANMATLEALGHAGWAKLGVSATGSPAGPTQDPQ